MTYILYINRYAYTLCMFILLEIPYQNYFKWKNSMKQRKSECFLHLQLITRKFNKNVQFKESSIKCDNSNWNKENIVLNLMWIKTMYITNLTHILFFSAVICNIGLFKILFRYEFCRFYHYFLKCFIKCIFSEIVI